MCERCATAPRVGVYSQRVWGWEGRGGGRALCRGTSLGAGVGCVCPQHLPTGGQRTDFHAQAVGAYHQDARPRKATHRLAAVDGQLAAAGGGEETGPRETGTRCLLSARLEPQETALRPQSRVHGTVTGCAPVEVLIDGLWRVRSLGRRTHLLHTLCSVAVTAQVLAVTTALARHTTATAATQTATSTGAAGTDKVTAASSRGLRDYMRRCHV